MYETVPKLERKRKRRVNLGKNVTGMNTEMLQGVKIRENRNKVTSGRLDPFSDLMFMINKCNLSKTLAFPTPSPPCLHVKSYLSYSP